MEVESGELLAVYEWSFQMSRNHLSRRRKQVLSIQQEFESMTSQGLYHPRLLQHLDMTVSPFEGDCRISVEVRGMTGCMVKGVVDMVGVVKVGE